MKPVLVVDDTLPLAYEAARNSAKMLNRLVLSIRELREALVPLFFHTKDASGMMNFPRHLQGVVFEKDPVGGFKVITKLPTRKNIAPREAQVLESYLKRLPCVQRCILRFVCEQARRHKGAIIVVGEIALPPDIPHINCALGEETAHRMAGTVVEANIRAGELGEATCGSAFAIPFTKVVLCIPNTHQREGQEAVEAQSPAAETFAEMAVA